MSEPFGRKRCKQFCVNGERRIWARRGGHGTCYGGESKPQGEKKKKKRKEKKRKKKRKRKKKEKKKREEERKKKEKKTTKQRNKKERSMARPGAGVPHATNV